MRTVPARSRSGHQWTRRGGTVREPDEPFQPRRRATYHRTSGTRQLYAALDLTSDKMYGYVKRHKTRT